MNNAGIGMAGSFLDHTVDDWDSVLGVNLWGVVHGSRLFAAQMVERGQGGHIVNTSSAAAFTPSRTLPAYATSKAADTTSKAADATSKAADSTSKAAAGTAENGADAAAKAAPDKAKAGAAAGSRATATARSRTRRQSGTTKESGTTSS